MSVYVMSDLHGEAEKFHAMLEKIEFSESDQLYIIGDVIDRGPEGIGLLLEVMDRPNMLMLLGNHEYRINRQGQLVRKHQLALFFAVTVLPFSVYY